MCVIYPATVAHCAVKLCEVATMQPVGLRLCKPAASAKKSGPLPRYTFVFQSVPAATCTGAAAPARRPSPSTAPPQNRRPGSRNGKPTPPSAARCAHRKAGPNPRPVGVSKHRATHLKPAGKARWGRPASVGKGNKVGHKLENNRPACDFNALKSTAPGRQSRGGGEKMPPGACVAGRKGRTFAAPTGLLLGTTSLETPLRLWRNW